MIFIKNILKRVFDNSADERIVFPFLEFRHNNAKSQKCIKTFFGEVKFKFSSAKLIYFQI